MIDISHIPPELVITLKKVNTEVEALYKNQLAQDMGVYRLGASASGKKHQYDVSTGENDSLKHIPYTMAYAKHLKRIATTLDEGLKSLPKNAEYLNFARTVMEFLASGNNDWAALDASFVQSTLRGSPIIWNFGPLETYSDKNFGQKRFFTSLIAIAQSKSATMQLIERHLADFCESYLGESLEIPVYFAPAHHLASAGEMRKFNVSGWSRPEDFDVSRKNGCIKQLYTNRIAYNVRTHIIPRLDPTYNTARLTEFVKKEYIHLVSLHEACHSIGKSPDARKRLGKYYDIIEEMKTDFISYAYCDYLIDQTKLPQSFITDMFKTNLAVGQYMKWQYERRNLRLPYYLIYCKLWELSTKNNKRLDFATVLSRILQEATALVHLSVSGDENEAKKYIAKIIRI